LVSRSSAALVLVALLKHRNRRSEAVQQAPHSDDRSIPAVRFFVARITGIPLRH